MRQALIVLHKIAQKRSRPKLIAAVGAVFNEKVTPIDESAAVQDAAYAAARRLRRGVHRTTATPDSSPPPEATTEAGEPGWLERVRLNGVDSFYRGSLTGAGRLALMQQYASTPDEPNIAPRTKRWRDQLRKDYPQVIADLARYDRMRGSSSAGELAAAALGQFGGGLPTPESLIGVPAKAATLLRSVAKAGLLLTAGTPLTPKGALGSSARRPGRPARLPMDKVSRMERADAGGFRRNLPLYGTVAPEGERIAAAAIKVGDRVFTAPNHTLAIEGAEAAFGRPIDTLPLAPIPDGFVTTSGRFVSRHEADVIANRSNQARPVGPTGFPAWRGLVPPI